MQQVELSVSFVLRGPWSDTRDTLLHELAHAIVGPGHAHDAAWQTTARRIGCTAKHCTTVTHSLKRWMGECRDRWVRQRLTARDANARFAHGAARPSPGVSTPTARAADQRNARAGLRRLLLAQSDDRPDGHRHRQDDRLRTCAAPAGDRLFRPTLPPLLTTRPGGASNDGRRTHRRPRPFSSVPHPQTLVR